MASVVNATRVCARFSSRHGSRFGGRRGFRSSTHNRAAQNYSMPALSPTMTEGNIASWRIKEGDSYSAGDVLLEIETDKATMDVEAQDDGVLFKITQTDGSRGVKVGERIAVMAEQGDDLSSLEMPVEDKSAEPAAKKEGSAPTKAGKPSEGISHRDSTSTSEFSPKRESSQGGSQGGKAQLQTYPLFPSVQQLLHENGLSNDDANSIPASGPKGRLLKGDVLAYIGKISKDYPAKSSERLSKLSHLDLSNIQLSKSAPEPTAPKATSGTPEPELASQTEIAVPISLSAVITTQKRVQDTLGIFLPLSTFVARASELANEDLPTSKNKKPNADELFNSVLGLDKVGGTSRGHFVPQVSSISSVPLAAAPRAGRQHDIIDALVSTKLKPSEPKRVSISETTGVATSENIFSVTVKAGDESRAAEYLDRMKLALEKEPGRLVL